MPMQITKDTSPDEVIQIAEQYEEILKRSNMSYNRDRTIADMEKRAADLQSPPLSVDEWRAMWAAKSAAPPVTPPPVTPAPAHKPARKGTKAKAEPEPAPEPTARGAVTVDPNYFWLSPENIVKGRTWVAMRRDQGEVMNMMVVGPAGCGKTQGIQRLAEEFGLPCYKLDCSSITTPDKWIGHKDIVVGPDGPQTTYTLSEHLRWLSGDGFPPGIVLYDDISRLHPQFHNVLIPILDGSESIWVPDLGIYIRVHPDTMIAATANIGSSFAGTYGMDVAFWDRWGAMMEQGFPPHDEEIKILNKRTGLDVDKARVLVNIATDTRRKAAQGELSKPVSTRGLLDAAKWAQSGMTIQQATEATFVLKYSDEGQGASERTSVRLIITGLAGNR